MYFGVISYVYLSTASFLWATAEEDGWACFHPLRGLAKLYKGLEVRLSGQLKWRRLHPGRSVCHRVWQTGDVLGPGLPVGHCILYTTAI